MQSDQSVECVIPRADLQNASVHKRTLVRLLYADVFKAPRCATFIQKFFEKLASTTVRNNEQENATIRKNR